MSFATNDTLTVLALMDTAKVSGPCRGLFQVAKLAREAQVRILLGLFRVGKSPTTPAIEEATRRGFETVLLSQRRRYDPSLILQARRMIRDQHVHIIQSHSYKPALMAWCLKRLTGLPWVAFAHGYTSENQRMALYNRLDRWLMRKADRVVAMSKAMAKDFIDVGVAASRIRVIHNAVDLAEYHLPADGTMFRSECGASPGDFLVGVIGRFSEEKGQEPFLRALSAVARSAPTVRAALVGEGIDEDRLRALVVQLGLQDRVRFTGYRTDISEVYAGLDLLVIPSLSEGLPNVLLEALLHGTAVVATAVGAIPEVLTGDLDAWLVPPGDVQALADGMRKALLDRPAREALSRLGRRLALEAFSPQRRVDSIMAVYREVTADHEFPQAYPSSPPIEPSARCV